MAQYTLTHKDGTVYELTGPEGATKEDLLRVLEHKQGRPTPAATPRDSTMGEEFARSARSALSSARTGVMSLLGDENAQARAGLERSAEIDAAYGTAPSLEGVKQTYEDKGLLAAIGEVAGQVPRYIAQQAPVIAQGVAGAKLGATLMPIPQFKPIAAGLGGIAAFIPGFTGTNIERKAGEQIVAGEDIDVDPEQALLTATGQASLQATGAGAMLGKNLVKKILGMSTDAPKEAVEQGLRRLADRGVLQNIVRGGVKGAAAEIPTEVAQQMLERNYAGLPLADDEAMAEYGEAAYASALLGGGIGGATSVGDRAGYKRDLAAIEAGRTPPGTPPPAAAAPTPVTPAPTTPPPGTAAPTPAPGSATTPLVPPAVNVDSKLGVAAAIRVQAAELGVTPTQEQAAKIQEIALGSPVDQRPKAIASLLGALAAPTDVVTAVPAEPGVAPAAVVEPAAAEPAVEPAVEPSPVATPSDLSKTLIDFGVSPRAAVIRGAKGVDVADPAQRQDAVKYLTNYVNNPVVKAKSPEVRAKVMEYVETLKAVPVEPIVEPIVEPTATPVTEPATTSGAAQSYQKWFEQVGQKFEMESQGQAILDDMQGNETNIHDVSDEFWQNTYPLLNDAMQKRFTKYVKNLSGMDVGSSKTSEGDLVKSVEDLGNFFGQDLPNSAENLEGQERGYVAMMAWANQQRRAAGEAMKDVAPATISQDVPTEVQGALSAPTATQPTPAAKPTEDALAAAKAEFEARGGKTTVVPTGKSGIAPLKSQPVSAQAPTTPLSATTVKSNQALKTKIEQGATPQQVLDHIIKDRNVPQPLRALARAYKTVSANIRYNMAFEAMSGIDVGKFQRYKDKISDMTLTTHKDHDYVQSFLHEHTHALASYAIDVESAAGKRIIELFNIYKKAMPNAKDYGLTDAHEFVAEALTNPAFQRAMRRYNVDGKGTSMWQRFVAALKSMIGMKDADPLLDELLSLTRDAAMSQDIDVPVFIQKKTDEYLAKVMGVETPEAARDALAIQGDIHKRVAPPISSPWYKRAWRQLFEDSKGAMHELIAWSLPMPALNDMAQDQFGRTAPEFAKGVAKITKIFADIEGATARFIQSIDPMKTKIAKFIEAHPDKRQDFNDLYNGGTIAAVDILKPRSTYAGDVDKLKAYDELTAGPWARLANTPGQQLYREVRASHDNQFRRMIDVVRSRMLVTTKDPALAAEVADKFQKLWDTGQLDGYGALMRPEGRYLLTYRVNNIEAQGFEKFDNIEDRDARAAQLNADPEIVPNTVTPFDAIDRDFFEGVAPNSFVGELLKTLKDGNADPALIDNVMRMAISVTPSNALMDRLTKRKNSPGYNEDALTAFLKSTVGLGVRLNNLQYGAETAVALRELTEGFRKAGSKGTAMVKMHNEIKKRVEYASNPAMSELSNLAKAGGYLYTLGGNVSSSLVDMSSLALVTYAQLGSKYGPVKASAAMMRIVPTILRTGTKASIETMVTEGLTGADLQTAMDKAGLTGRDMVGMSAVPSLLNIDFTDPNLDPALRKFEALVNVLKASGHSQRFSTSAEKVEQGASGWLSNLLAHAGFMMNTSERMKREIGIGAHYELELDRVTGGKPETATAAQMEAAANTALEESLLYNGGSTNLMGSRFQQQNLRSVLFMYKRFAVLMMYLQFRMFKRSFSADSDIRGAAHRQLGITLATAALLAGVKGMPIMGPLEDLWNLFADEEEGDEDFETMLRRTLGNTLTEGAVNTMTNANVSPRISLTNLLARDTNLPEDATLADQLASHLGGPVFGSLNRVYRGFELYNEGQIQRGVESMMPAALSNLLKTARFGTEGMRTLRGDQVSDVTFGGLAAQALGFAPADYARAMDFTNKQRRVDRSLAARRTNLYEQLYTAYRLGDPAGFQEAMQAMLEFNAAQAAVHPDLLFTPASIKQSLTTRDKNTRDMIMGALPSKTRRAEWEQQWDAWEIPE